MSINRHVILNHVDSPLKILLWTKGEIFLFVCPALFGLFFDQFCLGLLTSAANYWANKQYKKRFGKGQFQAVHYWYLPSGGSLKQLPPSYIREYLG